MMRDFFWEGYGEGKSYHLVKWDTMSKSKKYGGLGVGNIIHKNMALLSKWQWRFPQEVDSLWHTVIASKYGMHPNGWDTITEINTTLKSPWKSIAKGWNEFVVNTKLVVGRGDRIRFWEDVWVSDSPLKEVFPRLYRLSKNQNMTIQSVLSPSPHLKQSWNLIFSRNFNDRDCDDFISLLNIIDSVNFDQNSSDKRIWVGDRSGAFSCKSFFDILLHSPLVPSFPQSGIIWKCGIPSKIKVFAWLASLGKVNTCDLIQLRKPHLAISPSWCCLCKNSEENIDHILLHCNFTREVWLKFFELFGIEGVFPKRWADFIIIKWDGGSSDKKRKMLWRFAVMALAWLTWLERNKRVFEDKSCGSVEIWSHVHFLMGLWARASKLFNDTERFLFNLDCYNFLAC